MNRVWSPAEAIKTLIIWNLYKIKLGCNRSIFLKAKSKIREGIIPLFESLSFTFIHICLSFPKGGSDQKTSPPLRYIRGGTLQRSSCRPPRCSPATFPSSLSVHWKVSWTHLYGWMRRVSVRAEPPHGEPLSPPLLRCVHAPQQHRDSSQLGTSVQLPGLKQVTSGDETQNKSSIYHRGP